MEFNLPSTLTLAPFEADVPSKYTFALGLLALVFPSTFTSPLTFNSAVLSSSFTAPASFPDLLAETLAPFITTCPPACILTAAAFPSVPDVSAFTILDPVDKLTFPPFSTSIMESVATTPAPSSLISINLTVPPFFTLNNGPSNPALRFSV